MPKIIDGAKRRERIARAVWDIAAEKGLDHATVRAVADRSGLSVGSVQNSFRSQDDLKRFAMELVVQRVAERLEAPVPTLERRAGEGEGAPGARGEASRSLSAVPASAKVGQGTARAASEGEDAEDIAARPLVDAVVELLMETLPLDAEREKEARIWAAFSAATLVNENLAPYGRQMADTLARFCQACLQQVAAAAGCPLDEEVLELHALHLQSLLDGLTLSLLADPSPKRRRQARQVVRDYVHKVA